MDFILNPTLITGTPDLITTPTINSDKLNWICSLGCTYRWQEILITPYEYYYASQLIFDDTLLNDEYLMNTESINGEEILDYIIGLKTSC